MGWRIMSSVSADLHKLNATVPPQVLGRQEIATELKHEAERCAREVGVPVRFVTEHGEVAHAARALHADLIVVGRSAKTLHRLAGSLSHRLTCRSDAPVVVVVP